MPSTCKAQYAALVAAGEIEHDPAQARARRSPDRAGRPLARASPGAQVVVARLAVRRPRTQAGADQGALHLRRRRPRQDHADGPVLRGARRSCASAARTSTSSWPTCTSACGSSASSMKAGEQRRGSDPAHRRGARRGKLAALLRRIPRHRHRRRHDPRAAVHAAVRARRRGGRDLERARRTSSTRTGSTARCSCRSSR